MANRHFMIAKKKSEVFNNEKIEAFEKLTKLKQNIFSGWKDSVRYNLGDLSIIEK